MTGKAEDEERAETVRIEVRTDGLDDETANRFTAAAESAAAIFQSLSQNYGVELPEILIIGTLDFRQAVDGLLKQRHGRDYPDYTTERLGGTAVAKNVPLNEDHSRVAIVAQATPWTGTETASHAMGLYLLAHELTHSLLERLRFESGALEGVTFPSTTPRPMFRSITRIAVDELRADRVADIVLSLVVTKTVEGREEPIHITDAGLLGPDSCRLGLAELLVTRVHPGWRDTVNGYRTWGMTLQNLLKRIFEETDQMMATLGHAEAEAQAAPDQADLFLPPAVGTPGVTWLLGPVWDAVMRVENTYELIPKLAEFKAAEFAILDAGERELFEMWRRLGVTFDEPKSDGSYHTHVKEPDDPPELS